MKKITVIGGDKRLRVAEKLLRNDFAVDTVGLYEGDSGDIKSSDVLLLPVPTTKDFKTVNAPFSDKEIYLDDIKSAAGNKLLLTCGYIFEDKSCIDYGKLDSYSLLNAVPTAEGAIKLAIENTDFTLWNSRVLVVGCGRCGKVLAERLKALGADVTVSARRQSDLAFLEAFGFKTVNTGALSALPLDYGIIFNTVDAAVLPDSALKQCKAELLIDLSSKGGFNISTAENMGIKALKAPGLPGKTAPKTAGEILAKTVTELILSHI